MSHFGVGGIALNLRIIGKFFAFLLWGEALFLMPSVGVALIYREFGELFCLFATAGICAGVGLVLFLACRGARGTMYPREGFVVAGAGWLLISLFGALPFVISGEIPHYIDAFFETVSGFTTTGASILTNVEAMSHSLLFWRSFTHWLGGIGILVFILSVVPAGTGGSALQVLRAESPGPQVGKMLPKTKQSVRILLVIYFILSALNLVFLLAGGMSLFDSLCTMFGTAGTGGFGIKADSMASYSPYLQNVCTVFMMIFGANFSLYFLLLMHRDWKSVLRDEELRLYLGVFFTAVVVIAIWLMRGGYGDAGFSFHHAAFTVSSIMSTTGFATTDFDLWPELCRAILLVLMVLGAMAGSTAGGFKMIRVLIASKANRANMHRMLHPRSVRGVRVNGRSLDANVVRNVYLYLSVYAAIAVISFLLISVDNFSTDTNLSAMLSCFNNIGPGLAVAGPTRSYAEFSGFSKLVLSIDMLLGRLEIFPLLLLFAPGTWRIKS